MLAEPVIEPSLPKIDLGPEVVLLLSVENAARLLSLSRSTVYDLISKGRLVSVKIGRARRIPMHSLHIFIRSLEDSDQ